MCGAAALACEKTQKGGAWYRAEVLLCSMAHVSCILDFCSAPKEWLYNDVKMQFKIASAETAVSSGKKNVTGL